MGTYEGVKSPVFLLVLRGVEPVALHKLVALPRLNLVCRYRMVVASKHTVEARAATGELLSRVTDQR